MEKYSDMMDQKNKMSGLGPKVIYSSDICLVSSFYVPGTRDESVNKKGTNHEEVWEDKVKAWRHLKTEG